MVFWIPLYQYPSLYGITFFLNLYSVISARVIYLCIHSVFMLLKINAISEKFK